MPPLLAKIRPVSYTHLAEFGFAGDVDAEFAHDRKIAFGQNARTVRLAVFQRFEFIHRLFHDGIGRRADAQRDVYKRQCTG